MVVESLNLPAREKSPLLDQDLKNLAGSRSGLRVCAGKRRASLGEKTPPRRRLPVLRLTRDGISYLDYHYTSYLDRFMCEMCISFERWVIFCILTVLGGSALLIALDHFIGL